MWASRRHLFTGDATLGAFGWDRGAALSKQFWPERVAYQQSLAGEPDPLTVIGQKTQIDKPLNRWSSQVVDVEIRASCEVVACDAVELPQGEDEQFASPIGRREDLALCHR